VSDNAPGVTSYPCTVIEPSNLSTLRDNPIFLNELIAPFLTILVDFRGYTLQIGRMNYARIRYFT